jgi:hypothetical protein
MNVLTKAYANKYAEESSFNTSMSSDIYFERISNLEVMTIEENTIVTQQATEKKWGSILLAFTI